MRLRLMCLAGLSVAGVTGGVASAMEKPEAVGAAFCEAQTKDDEQHLRTLLTPSLVKVIEEAEARNAIIAKATPDEKPPFGDGIPYQSFPDHAPVCKVGQPKPVPGRIEIEVRYEFPDSPGGGWTDRLLLVTTDKGPLIDDILFELPADHQQIGLRSVLFNAFDQ